MITSKVNQTSQDQWDKRVNKDKQHPVCDTPKASESQAPRCGRKPCLIRYLHKLFNIPNSINYLEIDLI